MDSTTVTLSLLSLSTLLYLYLKYSRKCTEEAYALRNVKHVQPGNLFMIVATGKRFEVVNDEAIKREGPVFGFNLFGSYTLMVADPELIGLVLNKEFSNFVNRRKFNSTDPMLSANVMFTEDANWKRLRTIITPAFSIGKLKRMQPCFDDAIHNLINNLQAKQDNETIDFKLIISSFSMDVIIQTAFGIKIDSQSDSENPIVRNARKLFEDTNSIKNILTFTIMFLWPWLAKTLDLKWNAEVTEYFGQLAQEIIRKKKEERKQSSQEKDLKMNSFIELMIEAEENAESSDSKNGKFISNEEIIANCIMFFLAGFDTTTSTIGTTLYNLALYPEVQEKLFQELDNFQEVPNIETLSQLPYLTAVVNETLRLYSPAVFLERTASRDITLETAEYRIDIKKDDVIHIPVYSVHKNEKNFPEPEVFRPERFLTEGGPTFQKHAYIPFGSGPRNCIAKNLGYFSTKLALIQLVKNFSFEQTDKTAVPLEFVNNGDLAAPKEVVLGMRKRKRSK